MYDFIYKVILNSVIAYVFMFVVAKIMGKKQIAQLNFIDYVIGISIGSIGAEMATDYELPFYIYLIAIAIFCILEVVMTLLGRKAVFLKRAFIGTPIILVDNGRLDYANLCKSHLTIEELLSLMREKNYFNINEVAYCILETSGNLSILPKNFAMPTTLSDIDRVGEPSSLTYSLIVDGNIVDKSLTSIGKDTQWLLSQDSISAYQIKDILLAIYDNGSVIVYPK